MAGPATRIADPHPPSERPARAVGALLGCAVGDALGLPYEGLSPRRAARLLGPPNRMRLLAGRGMVSDDTEQSCLALQSWCEAPAEPQRFALALSRRLRWWLLALPAGVGMATLRALLRAWLGFGPGRSGVWSAGNGAAMRSVVLGAVINDPQQLRQYIEASAGITHRDPLAAEAAWLAALAAWCAARGELDPVAYRRQLALAGPVSHTAQRWLDAVDASLAHGQSTPAFAASQGWASGVSGYVGQTLPVVLHSCFSHPDDYRGAVSAAIACGGDADTTAAICGAILGARVGEAGIPAEWRASLLEWPRNIDWMRRLAEASAKALEQDSDIDPPRLSPLQLLGLPLRNLGFLTVVLVHGLRRALPPW